MAEMLAAFPLGPRQLQVKKTAVPDPGPGEVLLRVRACGICGSDLHFYRGQLPSLPTISPGHEFTGDIVEVGSDVQGIQADRPVCVEPWWVCRQCSYCSSGNYQLCPQRRLMGAFAPGGLAEFVTVPAYSLYPLPAGLDSEVGALVEPLAVAIHGLHLAGLSPGERVLVLGSGSIGLMAVLAARQAGAGEIVATYRYGHQGEAALAVGAHCIVEADEKGAQELATESRSNPADVVVETVGGNADTLQQAVNLVRPGGRVVVLGLFTQTVNLNAMALMLKEAQIVGAFAYCRPGLRSDFEVALGILQGEPEQARRLISHRFPLERVSEAFETALDKSSGALKVQVNP